MWQSGRDMVVDCLLGSQDFGDFSAKVSKLEWKEPFIVGNVLMRNPADVIKYLQDSKIHWKKMYVLVRLDEFRPFAEPYSRHYSRFQQLEGGALVFAEKGIPADNAVMYTFNTGYGMNYIVSLQKREHSLETAWHVFSRAFSEAHPEASVVYVECGEIGHLYNVKHDRFVIEWELNMTLLERCEYLDKLRSGGCTDVPSGKDYFAAMTE